MAKHTVTSMTTRKLLVGRFQFEDFQFSTESDEDIDELRALLETMPPSMAAQFMYLEGTESIETALRAKLAAAQAELEAARKENEGGGVAGTTITPVEGKKDTATMIAALGAKMQTPTTVRGAADSSNPADQKPAQ